MNPQPRTPGPLGPRIIPALLVLLVAIERWTSTAYWCFIWHSYFPINFFCSSPSDLRRGDFFYIIGHSTAKSRLWLLESFPYVLGLREIQMESNVKLLLKIVSFRDHRSKHNVGPTLVSVISLLQMSLQFFFFLGPKMYRQTPLSHSNIHFIP